MNWASVQEKQPNIIYASWWESTHLWSGLAKRKEKKKKGKPKSDKPIDLATNLQKMQRNNVQLHSENVINKLRPGNLQVKPLGFLAKSLFSIEKAQDAIWNPLLKKI